MNQYCRKRPFCDFDIQTDRCCVDAVAVLKQRREADAALFSELHRKLQTQVGVCVSFTAIPHLTDTAHLHICLQRPDRS